MNKHLLSGLLAGLAINGGLYLQGMDHSPSNSSFNSVPTSTIPLIQGLNPVHHPVTTTNREAQLFFDQGLTFIYAFNHDASYLSFKRASELDPNLAMAYWGMALALGSNINTPITPEKEKKAYEIIQKALTLAPKASPNEQAYIQALSKRYTADATPDFQALSVSYRIGMKEVVNAYPDDLDAATLYAESILDLNPWDQWTLEGEPKEGTMEVVGLLESIIKRDPDHLGGNHYYIHAVEASKHPEWALSSAKRLRDMSPVAGHILHMPSHVYLLIGDYEEAARANERAVAADRAYIQRFGLGEYYTIHYLSHNLSMLSRAYGLLGQFEPAQRAANDLQAFYGPHFEEMPELEYYYSAPAFNLLFFHRWQDILLLPPPQNSTMAMSTAIWHYARAIAYANLSDERQAIEEERLFQSAWKRIPPGVKFGNNEPDKILTIANGLIQAQFADSRGDLPSKIKFLQQAVDLQDTLHYNEPPDWPYSIRESLGGALLKTGQYKEAEQVFRQELSRHPRDGRALFGLLQSLKAQAHYADAFWIEKSLEKAWRNSDYYLTINSL